VNHHVVVRGGKSLFKEGAIKKNTHSIHSTYIIYVLLLADDQSRNKKYKTGKKCHIPQLKILENPLISPIL
jgi:hypothetical protein